MDEREWMELQRFGARRESHHTETTTEEGMIDISIEEMCDLASLKAAVEALEKSGGDVHHFLDAVRTYYEEEGIYDGLWILYENDEVVPPDGVEVVAFEYETSQALIRPEQSRAWLIEPVGVFYSDPTIEARKWWDAAKKEANFASCPKGLLPLVDWGADRVLLRVDDARLALRWLASIEEQCGTDAERGVGFEFLGFDVDESS